MNETITALTTEQLAAVTEQARVNMIEAWRIQSQTTVDDGYAMLQTEVATWQAQAAQKTYFDLYNQLEARYVAEFVHPVCFHMHTATVQTQDFSQGEPVVTEFETCLDCGARVEDVEQYDEIPF